MLDKAVARPRCRRFLNLTTGECIRMDLPELEEHALLALTPEGLILLLDEPTRAVRLLNPLTRQLTDLPPVTALLTPEWQLDGHLGKTIEVHGASIVDASIVLVSFKWPEVFVVAKPGDERWTLVDNRSFESVLPSAGRLYCATRKGVEVLNANTDEGETPRLLTAIDWGRSLHMNAMMNDSLHLVDNAGDLMLVHRMMRWDTHEDDYKRKWAVYKVDLDSGVLVPAKSFCGRAVFMGLYRTVSVSLDAFDIAADTLYFGYECGGEATYNLGSGEATYYRDVIVEACDCDETDEACNHNMDYEWQGPLDIVSCLCDCIQGIGKELA
jgi:hypothetical protein